MDTKLIGKNTTLYLPVFIEGGLSFENLALQGGVDHILGSLF